jgi:hypothetical protein
MATPTPQEGTIARDVLPPAPIRLYRATVSEHSMLDPAVSPDRWTPVTL